MLQSINVFAKLFPTHLKRLQNLPVEIGGRFLQFRKGRCSERLVIVNSAVGKIADPAVFQNPVALLF